MKKPPYQPQAVRRQAVGGFTLLELMVAMVVTTIILLLLLTITQEALNVWLYNHQRVRASRQAKFVLDQMAKDFESFQMRLGNGFEWLYAGVDTKVREGAGPTGDAAQLGFFTSATDRYNGQVGVTGVDNGGDVAAVVYRLVFKDPIKNDTGDYSVFALYRNLIDPDKTFEELLGRTELIASDGESGPLRPHLNAAGAITNFVSENIFELTIGFLIQYTEEDGSGSSVTKYRRISVIDTSGDAAANELRIRGDGIFIVQGAGSEATEIDGRIVGVDLTITVLTETAANVLRNEGLTGEKLEDFIVRNSYQYTKAVNLKHL